MDAPRRVGPPARVVWPARAVAVVVAIVGALLVGPGFAGPAWACSCAGGITDIDALSYADAAFTGTVLSVSEPARTGGVMSSGDPVTVVFGVDEVFKGEVHATDYVTTAAEGASCGTEFGLGGRYLVFANADDQHFITGLCSGDRLIFDEPTSLPGGAPPLAGLVSPPSNGQPRVLAVGVVGGLGGVALLGLIWRRRRAVRAVASVPSGQ